MKVYTEVNYIWKDNKLVQTDSKSYEYEGEVTKCDKRTREVCAFGYCKTVSVWHSHGTTSVADVIPDDPADLLNNTLNLGGDIVNLGGDVLGDVFDTSEDGFIDTYLFPITGTMDLLGIGADVLGKGGLFTNDLISGIANGDWTGANVGKHGLFGLGTPHLPIPKGPNLDQPMFQATNLGDNINWLGGKLSGKGYLHDRLEALGNWSRESLGHVWDFIGNPKDYMVNDKLANMLLNQSGIVSAFGSSSGDDGGGDEGTSKYVKGRGTMKGRSPTLKLNKGGKGLGRKSLRIGTGGMGEPVGGKFKTYKSGRYTRVH